MQLLDCFGVEVILVYKIYIGIHPDICNHLDSQYPWLNFLGIFFFLSLKSFQDALDCYINFLFWPVLGKFVRGCWNEKYFYMLDSGTYIYRATRYISFTSKLSFQDANWTLPGKVCVRNFTDMTVILIRMELKFMWTAYAYLQIIHHLYLYTFQRDMRLQQNTALLKF